MDTQDWSAMIYGNNSRKTLIILSHKYIILDECTALWHEPYSIACAEAVVAMSRK